MLVHVLIASVVTSVVVAVVAEVIIPVETEVVVAAVDMLATVLGDPDGSSRF
jgi:hypothetical protein